MTPEDKDELVATRLVRAAHGASGGDLAVHVDIEVPVNRRRPHRWNVRLESLHSEVALHTELADLPRRRVIDLCRVLEHIGAAREVAERERIAAERARFGLDTPIGGPR